MSACTFEGLECSELAPTLLLPLLGRLLVLMNVVLAIEKSDMFGLGE